MNLAPPTERFFIRNHFAIPSPDWNVPIRPSRYGARSIGPSCCGTKTLRGYPGKRWCAWWSVPEIGASAAHPSWEYRLAWKVAHDTCPVYTAVQILQPLIQARFVFLPGKTVHARGRFPLQQIEAVRQKSHRY